jgi:hypothetical protein
VRKILGAAVGLSDAERARRSRRHRKGDHSLCDASRCDSVTTPVTTPVTRPAKSTGLGPRGRRLWREMAGDKLDASKRVLLEEACRIADRLDKLDALLLGDVDAWFRFTADDSGAEVTVTVDKALSEARHQAVALKQIVSELRQGAAAKPETGGSVLDQLAARREARRTNASG